MIKSEMLLFSPEEASGPYILEKLKGKFRSDQGLSMSFFLDRTVRTDGVNTWAAQASPVPPVIQQVISGNLVTSGNFSIEFFS